MRRSDREITDKSEIQSILQDGKVCHLALLDNGEPYIVALNYGFLMEGNFPVLYFHCAREGKKLDCIRSHSLGCMIVDTGHELVTGEKGCDWGMKYRSVVGKGTVEIVENMAERKMGLDLLMKHYSGRSGFSYDERVFQATEVLKMTITEMTGKKKN